VPDLSDLEDIRERLTWAEAIRCHLNEQLERTVQTHHCGIDDISAKMLTALQTQLYEGIKI
jgi:hypothetical protein